MQRYVVGLLCAWLLSFSWCAVQHTTQPTDQISTWQLLARTEKAIGRENIKNSVKITDYVLLWKKIIDDTHQELYLIWNFEEFGLDSYGDIVIWWWASKIPFVLGITKENGTRTYGYSKQAPDGSLFLKWLKELFPQDIVQVINGWTYVMQIDRPLWERAEEALGKKIYTPYSWSRPRLLGKRCEINVDRYLDQWLQEFKKTDSSCIWENGIDYTMIFGSGWYYQDFLRDINSQATRKFSWSTGVVLVQEQDNSWTIVHQRRIRIIEATNDTMKIKLDIL